MSYQKKLGLRLRELRLQQSLSIRTLAARTGFSPSFISQLEGDTVSPSISSLERITNELGVSLGQLFSSMESDPRVVIHVGERNTHHSAWSRCTVESLNDVSTGRRLSAILVTFELEGMSGNKPAPIRRETFAMVASGQLMLDLDDTTLSLSAGDTVYLHEGSVFRWYNQSAAEATLILVSLLARPDVAGGI